MSSVAVVSFRLGGTDGVSIEAAKWVAALERLGHDVRTVAGTGVADHLVAGLDAGATTLPSSVQLEQAIDGCDIVVVENVASLPLNVAARDVLYGALGTRHALFRHHDLPWQRDHLAHLPGPRDAPQWRHVTINDLSRRQLQNRGIEATTMYNTFDCSPVPGRRDATRRALGVSDEPLVVMMVRAIERKNVAGALELCDCLHAVLWITGPAEDGYGPRLESLLASSPVSVRRLLPLGVTVADAYAAADLVVMSSTWEGFGNPVLESVTHRRPLALNPYPVALEITAFGFDFFDLRDIARITAFLERPDQTMLDSNLAVAREHFNIASLPSRLDALLANFPALGEE